jgi:hypothetical protein
MLEVVCLEGTVTHELMVIMWFLKHYAGYDCIEDLIQSPQGSQQG